MMKKNDVLELKIDNITNGGEGIGRIDGYPVFVENTAIEDVIKVKLTVANKRYAKGQIVEIVEPSTHRIEPKCRIFKVCGGCQWHHIDYAKQLEYKKIIIKDCFRKFAKIDVPVNDVIPSDNIYNYRCKVQYPVQQTKNSKRILAGYYKKNSHDIINIKHCPIQPSIIDEITEYLRLRAQELGITAYEEETNTGMLRHFVFRIGYSSDKMLLTIVINAPKPLEIAEALCQDIAQKYPQIEGTLLNFNTTGSNLILGNKFHLVTGNDFLIEELKGRKYKISAGSFFQVNPSAGVKLFDVTEEIIKSKTDNPTILDVYAGVGSFSIWLKDLAKEITAIDSSSHSSMDAVENIKLNNCEQKITYIEGNADNILTELVEKNSNYDVVILDPPRKGCSPEVLESAASLANKYIIYVSCNPSTLARDTAILAELNYTPEFIQPVDMFCHTHHVECVMLFSKNI